jgi:hypothetical protein
MRICLAHRMIVTISCALGGTLRNLDNDWLRAELERRPHRTHRECASLVGIRKPRGRRAPTFNWSFWTGWMAKLVDGRTVWYGRPVLGCRVSIVAAVLSAAASITSPLRAAEPTNDAAWGTVVFAVNPQSPDAQAMIDAVRAHLTGLPVRLVVDAGGSAENDAETKDGSRRIGTLTIDPGTPGEWVVSFTEPAIDTTLVRRIRVKPQGKRVALEEAAIVVRSMVEAILDGGHVGIARGARGEIPIAPASSAAQRSRNGIAATAGYLGTTFAPNLNWQSGALLGLRWHWGELYAGVIFEIFAPIQTSATAESPVPILLVRHPGAIVAVPPRGAHGRDRDHGRSHHQADH